MCGIVGIAGVMPVNQSIYDALTVLQHRGQDAAGIITIDANNCFRLRKANGLVSDVFEARHMQRMQGNMGIGHVRYPTAGSSSASEAQPFYVNSPYGITLAHNGNLTNAHELRKKLFEEKRRHINTTSDSEILLNIFASELDNYRHYPLEADNIFAAIAATNRQIRGAYACVAMIIGHGMVAFRDPNGIRPGRRGGYCFEQNGLLERALREIGFNVRSLLGRVVLANPPHMPPRTHRLLLVDVEGERWIADVGFGGQTLTAPIKLLADIEQATPHGEYRLIYEGDEWALQFSHHGHWQSMYHFDLGRQYAADYVMGNFWSAHWPQSHFRHHLLMCRHLPDGGKMTLTNFHFTHWDKNHVVEKLDLADVPALYEALKTRFGLGVDDAKYGFSEAELAAVMAAFDTHPEAGK